MKEYNLSKTETDKLGSLFAIFTHYRIVMQTMDKEVKAYIVGEVFPRLGMKPEDFPFVNVDIREGKISLDEEKKAQVKKDVSDTKDEGWEEVKAEKKEEDEGWEADEKK